MVLLCDCMWPVFLRKFPRRGHMAVTEGLRGQSIAILPHVWSIALYRVRLRTVVIALMIRPLALSPYLLRKPGPLPDRISHSDGLPCRLRLVLGCRGGQKGQRRDGFAPASYDKMAQKENRPGDLSWKPWTSLERKVRPGQGAKYEGMPATLYPGLTCTDGAPQATAAAAAVAARASAAAAAGAVAAALRQQQ